MFDDLLTLFVDNRCWIRKEPPLIQINYYTIRTWDTMCWKLVLVSHGGIDMVKSPTDKFCVNIMWFLCGQHCDHKHKNTYTLASWQNNLFTQRDVTNWQTNKIFTNYQQWWSKHTPKMLWWTNELQMEKSWIGQRYFRWDTSLKMQHGRY